MMVTLVLITFIVGYAAIALEHSIRLNKAASAIITGVLCWSIYMLSSSDQEIINESLLEHLGEISSILFFLLGAMTIVELIDAHDGFDLIIGSIKTTKKSKLLWILSLLTFFLSAALDNLTTTIVMVSLVNKLIKDKQTRLVFCGIIVIAANAGGAWSPIGDVTTTMLWIGGQISVSDIILKTFFPSLMCLLVPLLVTSLTMNGGVEKKDKNEASEENKPKLPKKEKNYVLLAGIVCLLMVPVFKTITHLPPFMGMLLALGIMWVFTEILNSDKDTCDKDFLSVLYALRKIDASSILFFLGILLSVATLQSIGVLTEVAQWLDTNLKSERLIVSVIGIMSSIIDNVPLVAAAQGMYSLEHFPADSSFWLFLAYCAGTGGSMLIIGSAAGVAAMGIEKIEFFWYLKRIGWLAMIGYVAGIFTFILEQTLFGF